MQAVRGVRRVSVAGYRGWPAEGVVGVQQTGCAPVAYASFRAEGAGCHAEGAGRGAEGRA